ncbi:TPA: hypothetical protein ACY3HI_001169 [Citrobacter braakii]
MDESLSMLGLYFRYVMLFISVLVILLLSFIRTPRLTNRFRQPPVLLLLLLLAGFNIQAVIHQLRNNNLQSLLQRVLASTPASNANVLTSLAGQLDHHLCHRKPTTVRANHLLYRH